jgi:DNA-binding XRE family transcriptional regulator
MSAERPSRRHANIILSRARHGYDEDQLARFIGITRETMRKWAKLDKYFAEALDIALTISRDFWQREDDEVSRRELRDYAKTLSREVYGPKPRRKEVVKPKKPAITKEQLREHKRKAAALTKAEREQDDAAWDKVFQ